MKMHISNKRKILTLIDNFIDKETFNINQQSAKMQLLDSNLSAMSCHFMKNEKNILILSISIAVDLKSIT